MYLLQASRGQRDTMVTMHLLLLTVVQILPSVEKLSYRNSKYGATADKLLGKWYITRWAANMPISAKKKVSPLPPFKFVKNIIGKLEFRMNISKPIGCVDFKKYMDEEKPGVFNIWPQFQIHIVFLGGKDFAIAFHESRGNNPTHTATMFMGRNMSPKQTMLLDFEDTVKYLGLKSTDIINPGCDEIVVIPNATSHHLCLKAPHGSSTVTMKVDLEGATDPDKNTSVLSSFSSKDYNFHYQGKNVICIYEVLVKDYYIFYSEWTLRDKSM
ncbi:uncharacterized protein LOC121140147 [Mesocricetus auratus]|uniref:Uncharacterized protein LOC121140147 n=1 Tax=Mesocricetus auratus TaxID=10036 RepID=A0ABM2XG21_MESAU|nr:uncharacterized protein LOC121140147 [Mesocricetus auratus]